MLGKLARLNSDCLGLGSFHEHVILCDESDAAKPFVLILLCDLDMTCEWLFI